MAIDWSKASEVKQTSSTSTSGPDWGKARRVKDDSGELDSLRDYASLMARNYDVEEFLPVMFEIESASGTNKNDSSKGAIGPMQMMPTTFDRYKDKGWNIRNPKHNIEASARMLAELKEKYEGDKDAIVAYYNSGRNLENALKIPETRAYLEKFHKLNGGGLPQTSAESSLAGAPTVTTSAPVTSPQLPTEQPISLSTVPEEAYDPTYLNQLPYGVAQGLGDFFGTLAKPLDYVIEKATGEPVDTRKQFSSSLREMGADPSQPAFELGKLGGNLAVANIAPNTIAAGAEGLGANALANSIRNWGFAKNGGSGAWDAAKNYLTNVVGGAIAGGSSGYSINPDEAPIDAVIGAGVPMVGQPIAKALSLVGDKLIPKGARMVDNIMERFGLSPSAVRAQLLSGQSAVLPSIVQDVPRILQNPDVSYLSSRLGPDPNALWAARAEQKLGMENAIESVAPTISDVNNRPSTIVGQQIGEPLRAQYEAEKLAAKGKFNSVDPNLNQIQLHMPVDAMDSIIETWLPKSVLTEGDEARSLVANAKKQFYEPPDPMDLALDPTTEGRQLPMNWEDWQNWRGNFSSALKRAGGEKEKAALVSLKKLMDNAMEEAAVGSSPYHPDDFVTPDAWGRYREASEGWQTFKNQYEGRLKPIFQQRKGEYSLLEDQIPDKIYAAGDKQRETAKQFMDIAGGQGSLTSPIKSYITTSAKKAFDTGKKSYLNWLGDRASANSVLLNRMETEKLQEIGRLLRAEISEEGLLMQGGSAGNSYSNVNKIIGDSLDSPFIDSLLNENRTVGIVSRPLLRRLRGRTDYENKQLLATLLADPNKFLDAMETPLTNSWHSSSDNMLNVLRNTQPTFPAIINNNQEMR